ncbi:hypothetical protein JCM21900_005947 [Sporobolomyces salmonicolor]
MIAARTVLRSSASHIARPQPAQLAAPARFVSSSPVCAKSAGEGKGERSSNGTLTAAPTRSHSGSLDEQKKAVGGSNPVSARAEGVKQAAKSVVEGAQGIAQKATGKYPVLIMRCPAPLARDKTAKGDTSDKHAGPSSKSVLGEEIDRGLKEGGVKKKDEQGSI